MSDLKYRADIDGLRTVAVIPVVLFHLGLAATPGGFVGVDVFFVISGYLITTIIAREIQEERFSILTFYERRIRRLFPALAVVLAATLVAATLWFVPTDLSNTAQSAAAALLFVSNILFFLEAGYFDAASYTKPLLHTWSLAIEEQFYLFMPLLLLAARKLNRMRVVVAVLTALSLALSVVLTERYPTAAYYLIPFRSWELGVGALLALGLGPRLNAPALRDAASALGLALILCGVFFIDKSTPFPGSAALLPVLGTALILQAGSFGPSLVGRALSTRLPVFIGKLSYSLYLWHWPVIVFFAYRKMGMPDALERVALFALSLALAWLSWRFVERPFRKPVGHARPARVFGIAALAMAPIFVASLGLYALKGLPGRLPPEVAALGAHAGDYHPDRFRCFDHKARDKAWADPCIYGGEGTPRVALIGDSHAGALVPALERAAQATGQPVALLGQDGCPGLLGLEVHWAGQPHSCAAALGAIQDWVTTHPETDTIVMMFRPALYVDGWLPYGFREYGRGALTIGPADGAPVADSDRLAFFEAALTRTVTHYQDLGKRVILVYPLPEAGNHVPRALVRYAMAGHAPDSYGLPRAEFDQRNAPIVDMYDRIAAQHDLTTVRLDQTFCDAQHCALYRDGEPLYYDSNHLTVHQAERLAPLFVRALSPEQQNAGAD